MPLVLVNLEKALKDAEGYEYNSKWHPEWIKRITGLNKGQTTGYSLLGDFVNHTDTMDNHKPGLYLQHDLMEREGIKKKRYTLFELLPDGKAKHIFSHDYEKRDWAVMLWEHIDRYFEEQREIEAKLKASLAQVSLSPELSEDAAVLGGEMGAKMSVAAKEIADGDGIGIAISANDCIPLSKLVIKYAIEAQWNRNDRRIKLRDVDISQVSKFRNSLNFNKFSWDFSQFKCDLARKFGVARGLLPNIREEGDYLVFEFEEPEDER